MRRGGSIRIPTLLALLGLVGASCAGDGSDAGASSTVPASTSVTVAPSSTSTSTTVGSSSTTTMAPEPEQSAPTAEETAAFLAGLEDPAEELIVPSGSELRTLVLGLDGPEVTFDDQVAIDEGDGLGARFVWRVADRFQDSWDAHGLWWGYEDGAGPDGEDLAWLGYQPEFVQPDGWQVHFDACGSAAPEPITTYRWRIEGQTLVMPLEATSSQCSTGAVSVPTEGEYAVTLTVSTSSGWESTVTGRILVEDLLIVSLGDSAASGEGNPARKGSGVIVYEWEFGACHRSATSSHARAARAIEEADPHTSVTFLAFGCSGATIGNLLGPYRGISPGESSELDGGRSLPAQVEALARSLCADQAAEVGACPPGMMRKVDVLLLQVGINDVHFSNVLFACMNYPQWLFDLLGAVFSKEVLDNLLGYFSDVDGRLHDVASFVFDRPEPCHENVNLVSKLGNDLVGVDTAAEAALSAIPDYQGDTFGAIRRRLAELKVRIGEVIVVTYPGPWGRTDGDVERGCGVFTLVNEGEAEWMHDDAALALNQLVELEAVRNGWWPVPARGAAGDDSGVMDRFQRHGYCAGPPIVDSAGVPIVGSSSYFVAFTESLLRQFNREGTMHPNASGHHHTAQAILDALAAPKPDRVPDQRVTIVFDSLRLSGLGLPDDLIGTDGLVELDFSAWAAPQQPWPSTTPQPEGLIGDAVPILSRAAETRATIRVAPDVWTSLPDELTLRLDVSPADASIQLVAGSPDPGLVGLVTTALRLEDDPRLAGFEDILVIDDPEAPGEGHFPGYTEGGLLNIRKTFGRFENGVSFGAGAHFDRTVSSPGFFEIRYCVFVGDIPGGIIRPGSQVFNECRTLVIDE